MATQVEIPSLGESIAEATIANWTKGDGDYVKADDTIAELETDKATVELPAGKDGVLKILKPKGATVAVGEVVAEIAAGGKPAASAKPPQEPAAQPADRMEKATP